MRFNLFIRVIIDMLRGTHVERRCVRLDTLSHFLLPSNEINEILNFFFRIRRNVILFLKLIPLLFPWLIVKCCGYGHLNYYDAFICIVSQLSVHFINACRNN